MCLAVIKCFVLTGLRRFLEVFRVTPGTIQSCVSVLKDGHLLAIAPGKNLKENQTAKYKRDKLITSFVDAYI